MIALMIKMILLFLLTATSHGTASYYGDDGDQDADDDQYHYSDTVDTAGCVTQRPSRPQRGHQCHQQQKQNTAATAATASITTTSTVASRQKANSTTKRYPEVLIRLIARKDQTCKELDNPQTSPWLGVYGSGPRVIESSLSPHQSHLNQAAATLPAKTRRKLFAKTHKPHTPFSVRNPANTIIPTTPQAIIHPSRCLRQDHILPQHGRHEKATRSMNPAWHIRLSGLKFSTRSRFGFKAGCLDAGV